MAIDYNLALRCQSNDEPILRFYGWSPYCVSIGCHQKEGLINQKKLKQDRYDLVQRPTGGRAIFHAEELTYSVIAPRSLIHHRQLYLFIHQIFADALRSLGLQVELKSDNEKMSGLTHQAADFPCFIKSAQTEVQYKEKKLIGSAQKLYSNAILQHGSLLIGEKHKDLSKYIKAGHKVRETLLNEINEKTICLHEISNNHINVEKIIGSIINQLELERGISVNSKKFSKLELDLLIKDQ